TNKKVKSYSIKEVREEKKKKNKLTIQIKKGEKKKTKVVARMKNGEITIEEESSSSNSNDIQQNDQLDDEVSKQREHLSAEEQELIDEHIAEANRRKQRERDNPTLGKFMTTIRPLDGFFDAAAAADEEEEEEGSSSSSSSSSHRPGAPVQFHSRQSQSHSNPSTTTATTLLADAHYAKAIRMLSSPFDQLKNGGNAIPHRVYEGEYDQEIFDGGGGGRGDGFGKIDVTNFGKRRRRHQQKKSSAGGLLQMRKRRKKNKVDVYSSAGYRVAPEDNDDGGNHQQGGNGGVNGNTRWELPEDEPILNVILEFVYEWYVDTLDWIYESLGVELDYYGSDSGAGDSSGGGGGRGVYGTSQYEEDVFEWRDTRVGKQFIWAYAQVVRMWTRQVTREGASLAAAAKKAAAAAASSSQHQDDGKGKDKDGTTTTTTTTTRLLSKQGDIMAREGLFHLEKAAELGHSEAQRVVANSLASGILPISDHSLMHRLAEHQYLQSPQNNGKNWTSILLQSTIQVSDDFATGGQQLSRAIVLWHLSAMDGNVESAMALGYRHLYSAMGGGSTHILTDDKSIVTGYNPVHGGATGGAGNSGSGSATSHYGVLGTCPTALAYYEAAAHGVMDELESGPTKGKVNPPIDEHRLAEIYTHGGASSALDQNNKPDELEEALQYYRMLASRNRSPEPDLVAAFTIANFYLYGYRGIKQDLRLALKYYEICGDYNHWEGGGQAGLMHVWGIGMTPHERDLGKAYAYFKQGTPGEFDGCAERLRRKKRQNQKKDGPTEDISLCDRHSINGMGLLHLLGVEGLVDRNVNMARRWFEQGKDMGDSDSIYNYAMLRLGWMVTELDDLPTNGSVDESLPLSSVEGSNSARTKGGIQRKQTTFDTNYLHYRGSTSQDSYEEFDKYTGPSSSDYNIAVQELSRAAAKGHMQAKHKLGILYAGGANIPKDRGRGQNVVTQSCINAIRNYKSVADSGHTISRRNRAAWKQYGAGDYESALRNYLATAETGNEIGQVNAAFLLEQGYCLGMKRTACTNASIRLWRAAARQGNLEACLRVGDFYYYGRMKKSGGGLRRQARAPPMSNVDAGGEAAKVYDREEYLSSLEAKAFYFIPGPYRWTRYVLYPEELFDLASKWLSRSAQNLRQYISDKLTDASRNGVTEEEPSSSSQNTCVEDEGSCSSEWARYAEDETVVVDSDEEENDHMAIAAQYYRKAAEEHKSARANFNLGFMHEWGLGLTQDFPLAKRHYDLAGEDANMAAAIALWAMNIHQKAVKLGMILKEYVDGDKAADVSSPPSSDAETPPLKGRLFNPPNSNGSVKRPLANDKVAAEVAAEVEADVSAAKKKEKKIKQWSEQQWSDDAIIPIEDVINSMQLDPEESIPGYFPDYFEDGFSNLPWEANYWYIEETKGGPPFTTKYSAHAYSNRISGTERASLKLPMNSPSGGRICFILIADAAMPWEDLRFHVDSRFYQFSRGTKKYSGWVDICVDIRPGKHVLEWSMAWPHYYDNRYSERPTMVEHNPPENQYPPSGQVALDNVRFYPFFYDNFQTGDFSLQKWKQQGDGAPWVISEENERYSAHCGPTLDNPSGTSNLEFAVDLGYTGALLTFKLKVRTGNFNDVLWLYIDRERVRPWFGEMDEYTHYTQYVQGGGDDPEAGVWLDEVKFYSRDGGDYMVVPEMHDLGFAEKKSDTAKQH
ncbi:hypothetical protein ACHAXR_009688, partial [Thalassiosira sp. AJA248-18]